MTTIQGLFEVPDDYSPPPPHEEERKDYFYQWIESAIKKVFRAQGTFTLVRGLDNIPATGGALIAANHTGWFDFIFSAVGPHVAGKRLVRFMAKKEVFSAPVIGPLMRGMRHVPVDRAAGADSIDSAVDWIQNRGALVGIFPEGTISRSFELSDFKTGAARIAQRAGAPLIPCAIWGSQRIWTKDLPRHLGRAKIPVIIRYGEPVSLEGTPEEVTARLKQALGELLELNRAEYAERFGPFPDGERWIPASMGGAAPTLEEAKEMYRRERAERADRKHGK
ncbi:MULTISPECIES: lysophospholipid acyltransferase family protein [Corynebacterium]|uniref:1-acyl-sn-glycerol-3-phosphate acyltransferases n=3 Tax=Corynebacterium TaxID=1716 RepID=A0A1G9PI74_9CORY|nr:MULTISPECIES: lysophospholipid acyltransferase family protein [Corynebacterium]EEI18147.1 Acyltransferase [Corynebacterium lipophiloflavum DSM 44291]MBA4505871.1 1-acyl-sn-glycerol-3-phosphate acyltransferase [Corynebacterium sanguinis]MCT1414638.1 1-acyl-sn-glycerol-3-phosphate acyltransferase [Corynebacterium sanguinis]TVS26323.1 1-acyl-sn-glycerol-3-phosphate acyltransferase [Corynebacterium sanguinis]WNI13126.1 lysophospholipid acyltransferase family protein [Corynebacterium sp. Z-1]